MNVSNQTMQRYLTRTEQASFLARHPVVAVMVAETKAAILAGMYDWNYYDNYVWTWKFPGIIEPIGMQVEDSAYGLVTIQPARNGEIYFSGWTTTDLGTDKPYYQSPVGDFDPFAGLKALLYAGLAVAVVGVVVSAKKRG